ncbi:D-alanine transaminase [Seinonella peptonophila]|uniref:D-alanine aminotransferase n=1 Tax=Seinonella peptonophila TaxID=112248 RepID=A0A1M4U3D4_9BACL|nr:D-amino-acid transaminase [Seinonella peptonophila]SHE51146.1 D-alanine transaminase [Seinonella peptonophila]
MILYRDQLVERTEIHIDIEDRGYQFGDGVYEVIRVYHQQPFYLDAHLERLKRSAEAIEINLPYGFNQLKVKLAELVAQNQLVQGNVYLQVTRGVASRTHHFPVKSEPILVAYTQQNDRPIQALNKGVHTVTTEDIRWLRCDIKSLNLLGAVLAKQKAVQQHAHEAILVREGVVTEGSSTNLFIVENGQLLTHPANHLILHGITRQIVISIAEDLQIPVKETHFSKEQLYQADECFITSTTMEVCPVIQVDDREIGRGQPGKITRKLQNAFYQLIS